jgi:hydroxymethylpyrimidine pyrophosphatase-like HAD family hydrolase
MKTISDLNIRALATDFDGTLAHNGTVSEPTLVALERFKQAGFRLILVTGRELNDLASIFPNLFLFDVAVMENGAVLYHPGSGSIETLSEPPPASLVTRLYERRLPLHTGNAIVATWGPHEKEVREVIEELKLDLQIISNKGALMILPRGVDKASGLRAALSHLALEPAQVLGIGDAENDSAFLQICGFSVGVSNAVQSLKETVDKVTKGGHGDGVSEIIELLLKGASSRG